LPTRSRRNPIRSAGKDKTRSYCNRASSEPPGKAGRDHKDAATNVTKQRDQTLMQHQTTKLGIGILSRFVNLLRFLFATKLRACACVGMRFQKGPALPMTAYERDYELPTLQPPPRKRGSTPKKKKKKHLPSLPRPVKLLSTVNF
jgi:hypothetical protein